MKKNTSNNTKIDFLGIGVVKAGTTWYARCIGEHPDIFMPRNKELTFFGSEEEGGQYYKGIDWYLKNFEESPESSKLGEFTTHYMYFKSAPELIKKHFPDVKLLASLRDPSHMLYSFYWWIKATYKGTELPDTFEEAIKKVNGFVDRGFYYEQLKRFYDVFPAENIKVITLSDIKNDTDKVLRDTYGFLGVDPNFIPPSKDVRVNVATKTRNKLFAKLVSLGVRSVARNDRLIRTLESQTILSTIYGKLNKRPFKYPPLDTDIRNKLIDIYSEDVKNLEKLLNRDLSSWLEKEN